MIIEIRVKNCYTFDEQISFSMKADMRNKKFSSNVHRENNFNVNKTAGIYGPNNAGKTCLIRCIKAIKNVLLNKRVGLLSNIFTDNEICELGITFLSDGRKFTYDFKYDATKSEYLYEEFSEIHKDQYNNEKAVCWLRRDYLQNEFECIEPDLMAMMPVVARNNVLFNLIDTSKFEKALSSDHPYSMYENKIVRDYRDGKVTKEDLDECSTCDMCGSK